MRSIALFIIALLFFGSVSARQLENTESEELYNFIKKNYDNPKEIENVALFSYNQLRDAGIFGDYLYYAATLLSSSNLEFSNNKKALSIISSVPIDSITHLGTYYDAQLMKALVYKNNQMLLEADSLFTIILADIPDTMAKMKVIGYNNHAGVKELLYDVEGWKKNILLARKYNLLANQPREEKIRREALHLKNLSNYYISVNDVDSAKFYFDLIDTTEASYLTKLSYSIVSANIQEATENYTASIVSWQNAQRIASQYGFRDYQEEISKGNIRAAVLQEKAIKKQRRRWSIFGTGLFIVIVVEIHEYRRRYKEKMRIRAEVRNLYL